MKRLATLLLTTAGLAALLGSCGGNEEEEAAILAVAFRLDEGSPVIAAYIGDPAEDPFELEPGRYYIEALDQDSVLLTLGAVSIEDADTVEFPLSFEAAGGVADVEQAEPLITVASFLVDVELAEYDYLEVITGGYTESPFDPTIEPHADNFQEIFDTYAEIAAQEDAVDSALSHIEGRAQVSLGISYVRSPWAPASDSFEEIDTAVGDFFDHASGMLVGERARQRGLEFAENIPEEYRKQFFDQMPSDLKVAGDRQASSFDKWLDLVRQGALDQKMPDIHAYSDEYAARVALAYWVKFGWVFASRDIAEAAMKGDRFAAALHRHSLSVVEKSTLLLKKQEDWEEYARALAEQLIGTTVEDGRAEAQKKLEQQIKSDIENHFSHSSQLSSWFAKAFAMKVIEAIPDLAVASTPSAATTPSPTSTPSPTPSVTPSPTPSPEPSPTPSPAAVATATPTAAPTPDTGWIEGYVQEVADQWRDKGYSEEDVNESADQLRECLTNRVVADGFTREQAVDDCPAFAFEPLVPGGWIEEYVQSVAQQWRDKGHSESDVSTAADALRGCLTYRVDTLGWPRESAIDDCPTWLFEPTPTPEPTATPTPTPEATPTPTATPTPGQPATAKGSFTDLTQPVGDREWTENSVTLNFNTAGGLVTGDGRAVLHNFDIDCDNVTEYEFHGEYSVAIDQFNGTVEQRWNDECSTLGLVVYSMTWGAVLADGTIDGTIEVDGTVVVSFQLAVQGQ